MAALSSTACGKKLKDKRGAEEEPRPRAHLHARASRHHLGRGAPSRNAGPGRTGDHGPDRRERHQSGGPFHDIDRDHRIDRYGRRHQCGDDHARQGRRQWQRHGARGDQQLGRRRRPEQRHDHGGRSAKRFRYYWSPAPSLEASSIPAPSSRMPTTGSRGELRSSSAPAVSLMSARSR